MQSDRLLRQPMTNSGTLPESLEIPAATRLPFFFGDESMPLNVGLPLTALLGLLVAAVLSRTLFGIHLRAVGLNPLASRQAGMPIARTVVLAMTAAGALGGLAGAVMLQGDQYALKSGFSSGYGFDGLVVGLLARGSIPGVFAGALLFGFLRSGGINMEMAASVPSALVQVVQGLIILTAGRRGAVGRPQGSRPMNWELSAVFIGSAIRFATPLLLGATGELVSERAGVLNMSLEGMMLTGAFAGAVGAWATGDPMIGLALGILAVLPVALLQAFLSDHAARQPDRDRHRHQHPGAGRHDAGLPRDFRQPLARGRFRGWRNGRRRCCAISRWRATLVFEQVWLLYLGLVAASR